MTSLVMAMLCFSTVCTHQNSERSILEEALKGLTLTDFKGQTHMAQEALEGSKGIFFTCGCFPCYEEGKKVTNISQDIACISYLKENELRDFIKTLGWKGPVWLDPGSVVQVKLEVYDCPKFIKIKNNVFRICSAEELILQLR